MDPSCAAVCWRTENPAWDPYRSDCSGLVSWAWGLPPPGRTTYGFAPNDTSVSYVIDGSQLQPGDALNIWYQHIILFKQWITPGRSAVFIEEPSCSSNPPFAHEFTSNVSINGSSVYVAWQSATFVAIRSANLQSAPPSSYNLLFYKDATQNGTGDVTNPSVIGHGGWSYKFLFSGGNGIIYTVDANGNLVFYQDKTQDGTDDVSNPAIIGHGGWDAFTSLFSGGNGVIYAVDASGNLLFFKDATQNGTGDVTNPAIIGHGGWNAFKFLFSGGNGIIYAVDMLGNLLFYKDPTQDGKTEIANPAIIGHGGWDKFDFLFSGGNGAIYAVDTSGNLLFFKDATQNGTGDVGNPSVIGRGGWDSFVSLFAGGNGTIYGARSAN
jgi:hypothetical protein